MRKDATTNLLLMLIAIALIAIAIRPYLAPDPVHAQSGSPYPFYIEPGTQMLRAPDGSQQVYGRVVVDMRAGKVWGVPTFSSETYPVNGADSKPRTSHPFVLGKTIVPCQFFNSATDGSPILKIPALGLDLAVRLPPDVSGEAL